MNLYQVTLVSSEDSGSYLNEFVVAGSEIEAEDTVLSKYRGGLDRKDISATLVEVDGYTISIMPNN
jgi:hypothetical protein